MVDSMTYLAFIIWGCIPCFEQLLERVGADESVLFTCVTDNTLKLANGLRGAVFLEEKLAWLAGERLEHAFARPSSCQLDKLLVKNARIYLVVGDTLSADYRSRS